MFKFGFAAGAFHRPMFSRRTAWLIDILQVLLVLALLFALMCAPAHAGNTTFLTDKNGQVTFPLSPPNRATSGPGLIDNMTIGATTPRQGTFSQIISGGGLPTIASGACGTGTNGAVVAGSTDQSMKITIGAAATTTCTISFSATLSPVPKSCVFSPMNAAAIAAGALPFIAAPSGTGVVLSGSVLASTNWAIHCM